MSFYPISTIQSTKIKSRTYFYWLIFNTIIFVCLYPILNFLAAQRSVYTLYLQAELNIPFYPWAIIPYLSLPLLILANYIVIQKHRIKSLGIQFLAMTITASFIFYLYPTELGFTRMIPNGIWERPYQLLFWFDLPHNLFPSLHAGYTILLAAATRASLRLLYMRLGYDIWVILILLSLLCTHQHHVIDVLSGVVLAIIFLLVSNLKLVKLNRYYTWANFLNK